MPDKPKWETYDSWSDRTDDTPLVDSERYVSYKLVDLWPAWQTDARCSGVGTDYYFGDESTGPKRMSIGAVRRASKLCDACPVYADCLRWALENREEYGVWAGTSGRVRRRIFSLLDDEELTVDEVVEVFLDGGGAQFRGVLGGDHRVTRLRGLPDEAGRALDGGDLRDTGI